MRRLWDIVVVLVVGVVALVAVVACTDTDSMPTYPGDRTTGDTWQRLWPEFGCNSLYAAWSLYGDDAWAVGGYGAILYWDGQRVTMHESLTHDALVDVGGNARNDVWAVGGGTALHWDGSRWSRVAVEGGVDLRTVWCEGPDAIYVGGRIEDGERRAFVRRFDGAQWHDVPFAAPTLGSVRCVWRPGEDHPLMAATDSLIYRLVDGEFRLSGPDGPIVDANGDLVLVGDDDRRLFRVEPDGSTTLLCDGQNLGLGKAIAASRQPVIAEGPNASGIADCDLRQIYDGDWWTIHDLAVPTVGGPDSDAIFAVGGGSTFVHMVWQAWDLVARDLVRVEGSFPRDHLTGHDGELFAVSYYHNLLHFETDIWRLLNAPIAAWNLRNLGDGRLAIWNNDELAVGDPLAGDWILLPPCPVDLRWNLWVDASVRPRFLTDDGHFWAFDAGAWVELASWPGAEDGTVYDLDGRAVDDLWASGSRSDGFYLKHFDGAAWSDLEIDDDLTIFELSVGAYSGDVYIAGYRWQWGSFDGIVRDGTVHLTDAFSGGHRNVSEFSPGVVLSFIGNTIYQLDDLQWRALPSPNVSAITSLWGDPDHGLFTLAAELHVHRGEYPEAR